MIVSFSIVLDTDSAGQKRIGPDNYTKYHEREDRVREHIKNAEKSYNHYKSTQFDNDFSITVIRQSPDYGKSAADNYLIVVYQNLYNPATREPFMTYIDDLESEDWSVKLITATNNDDHVAMRDYLNRECNDNYIQGVFFIGGLAVAWYEMPVTNNDGDTTGWHYFPCDLYYMDIDGDWTDKHRDNGIYDNRSGLIEVDIWVGRLYTPTMTFHDVTETQLVIRYLQKNHDYRRGKLRLKDQAFSYVQEDWAWCGMEENVAICYDELTYVNEGIYGGAVTAADYRHRVRASTNNKYEWIYIGAHSAASYHCFRDENFYSKEIDEIDVQGLFFLNFNCQAALYTSDDCLCSWYVMQEPYGLLSVGFSKSAGMDGPSQSDYYEALNAGNTFGEALIYWGLLHMERVYSWHYGVVCTGDPTLKIGRFMEKPGPNFCYALSPGRDDTIDTPTPTFTWTETDSADYYNLVISGDPAEWISEDLQTTSCQIPDGVLVNDTVYTWSVKAYNGLECIDFSQPRAFTYRGEISIVEQFTNQKASPQELTITGTYPNPFNASTTIAFTVPDRRPITVKVYNAIGQEVNTLLRYGLLNGKQNIFWDGTDRSSQVVTSGLYFCRISDGYVTKVQKMLFIQ